MEDEWKLMNIHTTTLRPKNRNICCGAKNPDSPVFFSYDFFAIQIWLWNINPLIITFCIAPDDCGDRIEITGNPHGIGRNYFLTKKAQS